MLRVELPLAAERSPPTPPSGADTSSVGRRRMIEVGAAERPAREVAVGGTRELPQQVGVLPLRDTVTFPEMLIPLNVGQPRSIELINEVLRGRPLDRDGGRPRPRGRDARPRGPVLGRRARHGGADDPGARRARCGCWSRAASASGSTDWVSTEPYLVAEVAEAPDVVDQTPELVALMRNVQQTFTDIVEQVPYLPEELQVMVANVEDPSDAGQPDRRRAAAPDRREAGAARGARRGQAPAPAVGDPGPRARGGGARLEDPVPGPVRAREGPARVLPAPAAQGDPGGARRGRRGPGRGQRAARAARRDRAARGGRASRSTASWAGSSACSRRWPSTAWCATTWSGSPRCRGTPRPRTTSI